MDKLTYLGLQYDELDLSSNKEFIIKYRHILIFNNSPNYTNGFMGTKQIFHIPPNATIEVYDLFDLSQITRYHQITFSNVGLAGTLEIHSFGV